MPYSQDNYQDSSFNILINLIIDNRAHVIEREKTVVKAKSGNTIKMKATVRRKNRTPSSI
ncbi:MAG TPA: hypothetical protein PJ989_12395 [Oligoflexia bacterium]|nr:hypothetical protein [Oligoflexia bacterium]